MNAHGSAGGRVGLRPARGEADEADEAAVPRGTQRPRAGSCRTSARCLRLRLFLALAGLLAADVATADDDLVTPHLLLLDGVVLGTEVIAVGERGTILRSTDQGSRWHRLASPTRATLTGVSFSPRTSPRLGWAVGHEAVILHSGDGGQTWAKQFQGDNLQDSLLDVLALDAERVIAVGAYGLAFVTTDGGRTWRRRTFIEDDVHFNRISRAASGILYLAGERGTLLRSADLGESWQPLAVPYEGSFYGVLPLDRRTLVAYGLRGHAYRSNDEGATWRPLPAPAPALLATAVKLRNNDLVLAGQARALFVSRDGGGTLQAAPHALPTPVAELLELPDGRLLALGEAGASVLPAP